MEMKLYQIDQMRTGDFMALIRIFEIEVLDFGASKSSVIHSSKPLYLSVKMGTQSVEFFYNAGRNKLNVSFDLKEHFFQKMINIDDEFGNRIVEVNIPHFPNTIFPTFKRGYELGGYEDHEDYEDDDDFSKLCPVCKESRLENYETCEFCGTTRYDY